MANIKKFKKPVLVQIRVEEEVKTYIIGKYGNITEYINKLIKKDLKNERVD